MTEAPYQKAVNNDSGGGGLSLWTPCTLNASKPQRERSTGKYFKSFKKEKKEETVPEPF